MSAQVEVVEAQPRPDSSRGKNEARRLRASGRVPAVVYGVKKNTLAVSVDPKVISRILASDSGHNTIFDLQVDGEKTKAMIVDWQFEPIRGSILHIDLKRIAMDEKMHVIGDVRGRTCLIIDDIIDTAGTLVKTADALMSAGASKVFACASHPVLSGPAIERISKSQLEQVIVTNTIPLTGAAKSEPKIKVLSIAGLLGRAIQSIHEETSVSSLFA